MCVPFCVLHPTLRYPSWAHTMELLTHAHTALIDTASLEGVNNEVIAGSLRIGLKTYGEGWTLLRHHPDVSHAQLAARACLCSCSCALFEQQWIGVRDRGGSVELRAMVRLP